MPAIKIDQRTEAWYALRKQYVGSSESATLVGFPKWKTPFQLHHEKLGTLEPEDLDDDDRVLIGSHIESGIAAAAAVQFKVELRKCDVYYIHEGVPGMGASLDFEQNTEDAGWVPAEIKNVDWVIFKTEWQEDDELGFMPPAHYLIQLQHQLACTGKPYGFFYVLVGGNDLKMARIPRHDRIIASIETAVTAFWEGIRAKQEPKVDYAADRDAMQRVFMSFDPSEKDMRGDAEIEALMGEYLIVSRAKKLAESEFERVKARIFVAVKDYEKVVCNGGKINCALKEATPERQVTYKAQPARRELRVYPRKGAAE
jgi:putative phage-type endonuclease